MTDTLVIYYSLEGNVDFLAREVAKKSSSDIFRLETVKEYPKKGLLKFFHGGKDASMGFKPELKNPVPDLSSYSKIVIGCPVWAGKPAAPLNTLFEESDFSGKKIYLFASSAGGDAEKCLSIMEKKTIEKGGSVIFKDSYVNPLKNIEISLDKINAFCQEIKK